jgi:hypothetical protein
MIGYESNLSDSVAIPTHRAGDLIAIHASNPGSATLPTRPNGWVSLAAISSAGGSVSIGYLHAVNNATVSNSWTNAQHVFASVWRGDPNTLVVPEFISTGTGTTINVTYLSQTAGTLKSGVSDQALLAYVLNASATNPLNPPGALQALSSATDGSVWQAKLHYQLSRSTIWSNTNTQQPNSAFFRTVMLALLEYQFGSSITGFLNPFESPLVG